MEAELLKQKEATEAAKREHELEIACLAAASAGGRPEVREDTHVQYTQTDTIRQTDSPLIPMVGLVPIGKDVIPMVLLVNMHLIKGTLIIFPWDLAGYRVIPMVHWYQWCDWYQWKSTLFQWFYW